MVTRKPHNVIHTSNEQVVTLTYVHSRSQLAGLVERLRGLEKLLENYGNSCSWSLCALFVRSVETHNAQLQRTQMKHSVTRCAKNRLAGLDE
ncbi:hypothetical protein WN51_11801 [Melipona quadrifasciata]|uniref:Uncharacterized protein n=1 Tax=Melipona quadrifasciata TaxID=166423 RepID=A0A0M9A451_9HYME|nr:hypothetical protein WN51_11801 [Melipona quadrifasciata]